MINCIAIDDEPLALTQLTGYISRVPFLNLVASCQDAFDAMSVLSAQKIDLMFVDINMPDLNGMDFVSSLTEKSDYRVTRINLADIKYIEGMSEYVRIFVEGEAKPIMPLLSMKRLEETLPPSQFMRVHRSYIVNLKKITEVSRLRIVFGETYIPVGENYKDQFTEYINSRMMK